jgi:hypothetical protein
LRPTELLQFLAEGRQIHAHLGIMLKIWHQGANALQLARQLRSNFSWTGGHRSARKK